MGTILGLPAQRSNLRFAQDNPRSQALGCVAPPAPGNEVRTVIDFCKHKIHYTCIYIHVNVLVSEILPDVACTAKCK